MTSIISQLTTACGKVSAWLFFFIGVILVYEVVVRYVFIKPTIWVEEIARFLQIWATYLTAAYVLKNRHLITIRVARDRLPAPIRLACEVFSLGVIGVFCLVAVWYGSGVVVESIQVGRASSTMLGVPLWMTLIAIPIGFTLLALQVVMELLALLRPRSKTDQDQEADQ